MVSHFKISTTTPFGSILRGHHPVKASPKGGRTKGGELGLALTAQQDFSFSRAGGNMRLYFELMLTCSQ